MEVAKKANKTENAEQRKAYMKAYRESKKEEMKQYFREYYKTNKEELNEKHKAYNKETRARQRELRKEKKKKEDDVKRVKAILEDPLFESYIKPRLMDIVGEALGSHSVLV